MASLEFRLQKTCSPSVVDKLCVEDDGGGRVSADNGDDDDDDEEALEFVNMQVRIHGDAYQVCANLIDNNTKASRTNFAKSATCSFVTTKS